MQKQTIFLIATSILLLFSASCRNSREKASQEIIKTLETAPYHVWITYSNECPLCIRYTSTLRKIRDRLPQQWNFKFIKVIPEETWDFEWSVPLTEELIVDSSQALIKHFGLTVFPEALITDRNGKIHYRGAIDDRAFETGLSKFVSLKPYLSQAIEAIHHQKSPEKPFPTAKGCYIESYE
jgi:thioredoxin-related protein